MRSGAVVQGPWRPVQIVVLAGYIAWFGGLLRLSVESAALGLANLRLRGAEAYFWIAAGIGLALGAVVLLALLPWYRRLVARTRQDLAVSRGAGSANPPPLREGLRRRSRATAVSVGSALLLAVALPGLVAAAVSMLVGLVLRVAGLALAVIERHSEATVL